jgi:hypothetical protein
MQPHARKKGLIVQELEDETLVYDLESHRASCLNRAASLVWRRCDGRTPPAEMAARLGAELPVPADEEVVRLAIRELGRAGLLRQWPLAKEGDAPRCSRRELARRLGLVGGLTLLLPLVEAVVAPTPAMAASCVPASGCNAGNTGVSCGVGCTGICQGGVCVGGMIHQRSKQRRWPF